MIKPEDTFEIKSRASGELGDGYYIYKNGKTWGWAMTENEAKILIQTDQMKSGVKKRDWPSKIEF